MGNKLTKAVIKTAEELTRRSVNLTCTWILFQPKISKNTCEKLKKTK